MGVIKGSNKMRAYRRRREENMYVEEVEEVQDGRSFLEQKLRYDSLSQAVRLAKANGIDEDGCRRLLAEKAKEKETYIVNMDSVLKSMSLSNNITKLSDEWYGIRYIDTKSTVALRVEILNPRDIPVITRDGRRERDLTRSEMDALIPAILDHDALDRYKNNVASGARDVIKDVFNIEITEVEEATLLITFHAGVRYVQRVLGLYPNSEGSAGDYRKGHGAEIDKSIADGFAQAELLWVATDGVEYYFDANNIVYVKTDQSIVTLYESDFGFSKPINRSIVLQHIQVVQEEFYNMEQLEVEVGRKTEEIQDQIASIESETSVLEAQIAYLNASKNTLNVRKDELGKDVVRSRLRFQNECNKLFKKH